MIYNQKIEVVFDKNDQLILDSQSKMCNWLYNHLFDMCNDDYYNNNNSLELLKGRNLRNQVPKIKQDYPFLKSVYSSVLKNVALRLVDAFKRFFKGVSERPHFRSWKKKWFSLYYEEVRGFKINDKKLTLVLGKNEENKQIKIFGTLKETLHNAKIKTFRLTKEKRKFYAIFTLERETPKVIENPKSFISIDQNHKNFFVGIDNNGNTLEFVKLYQTKYFDKIIDELKSKRDKCNRKHKKRTTFKSGKTYYVPSKSWVKYDNAIKKVQNRRREQIKSIMYSISHFLVNNYDHIIIGDYTPTVDVVKYDTMSRSMLNQTHIGEFRNILKWVCEKEGKNYSLVDESNTTKTCSVCGHLEKKDPTVRDFTCTNCHTFMLRDVNSAINIAHKEGKSVKTPTLDKINKFGHFDMEEYKLKVS